MPPDDDKPDKLDRPDGVPAAVIPTELKSGPVRALVGKAVSGGVEALGTGLETLGEGVAKLGDLTNKVPLVGANIGRLGEAVAKAGESIQAFPAASKTRRGRLLVRSTLVSFILIALWIGAIAAIQTQGDEVVDFRPQAERILVTLGRGSDAVGEVYEHSSPRFQEMVRKERFIDDMTDLAATAGAFREITAINDTLVTTGPTGRVGRVSFTAAFARGVCRGSISFVWEPGARGGREWKLLGLGVELPQDLKITQAEREQRVAACKDPDDRKTCDVRDAAETILEQLRAGNAGEVWDDALDVFEQQITRPKFIALQQEHAGVLGAYKRILRVTEAKVIGGTSATFDVVVEFERSSGVRAVFGFERQAKASKWQLRSFKLVVPMPRADDGSAASR